jgi:hypothetical protein
MSRMWITARPSFAADVMPFRRNMLRKAYRQARTLGLDRHEARMLISGVLHAGRLEAKP